MGTTILQYFFIFILLYYIFIHHLLPKIQNRPPSPSPSLPFLGHLHLLNQPLHRTLSKISDKYGPILLLWFGSRPVLLISSPSAANECFSQNDVVFANRPRLLAGKHLGYDYTAVVWAPYGDHWRNLRRISSLHLLSSANIQSLSSVRADEVRSLIRRLCRTNSNQIVDVRTALFEFMLNVMMRMIGGKRYFGDNAADAEESRNFHQIVSETFKLAGANIVDYLPMLKWIGISGKTEKRYMNLRKRRDKFIQKLIEEQRIRKKETMTVDENSSKKTMIEVMLSLQESDPEYYTDEIIKGLMLVMLSAGTDTSVGTMEWAISLLLNHPHVLTKARSEMTNLLGEKRHVEESDVEKLPYLQCVIKETLRMYPVGPLLVPHESSADCRVGGYNIPRGTMLIVNAWAIQNDGKNWEDPTLFKPERFLDDDDATSAGGGDGLRYMPFGVGRRRCPGEGLALRVVGLVLGSLIQCFEWDRIGDEMVDMAEGTGLTMPKAHPLQAKFTPRPILDSPI